MIVYGGSPGELLIRERDHEDGCAGGRGEMIRKKEKKKKVQGYLEESKGSYGGYAVVMTRY